MKKVNSLIFLSFFLLVMPAAFAAQKILIPLYNYPQWYNPPSYIWDDIAQANSQVPIIAIINPNSGPGGPPNSDYIHGMQDLRDAGVTMIGYVHTSYGDRNINDVKDEIDIYNQYFNIDGIFFDEVASSSDKIAYYKNLHDYVKFKPNLDLVVLNPGININEGYFIQSVGDIIVISEGHSTSWPGYLPDSYVNRYPNSYFSCLIYGVLNENTMRSHIDLALSRNMGYVYLTNDVSPNPWDALPSFWKQEIDYIESINLGIIPTSTTITIPVACTGCICYDEVHYLGNTGYACCPSGYCQTVGCRTCVPCGGSSPEIGNCPGLGTTTTIATTTTSSTSTSTSSTTTTILCSSKCTSLGYNSATCNEEVSVPTCASNLCRYATSDGTHYSGTECSGYCSCYSSKACNCDIDTCDTTSPYCHIATTTTTTTIVTTTTRPTTTTASTTTSTTISTTTSTSTSSTTTTQSEFTITSFVCSSSGGAYNCRIEYPASSSKKYAMFLFTDNEGKLWRSSIENINQWSDRISTTFYCGTLAQGTYKISYWVYNDLSMGDLIEWSGPGQKIEASC